jgi:lysosomal acid lipase/cholesteryl ester hydrolase
LFVFCSLLFFLLHDKGSAQAFAALSCASPSLAEKVSLFIALAPAVYPLGFRDSLVSSFFSFSTCSEAIINLVFGSGAMLTLTGVSQRILSKSFFASAVSCSLHYLFSCTCDNISIDRRKELFQHVYSPSSVKCVKHWLQNIKAGCLIKYNCTAHVYDVSRITSPVAVIHGEFDQLIDAERVIRHIKTCVLHKKVPCYEHLDLLWSDRAHIDIFPVILDLLRAHKSLHTDSDQS